MNRRLIAALLAATLSSLPALAQQGQQPDLGALMGALGAMMQGNTNSATVATVTDFRELKALLPPELPGMKRTSASGEKSGAMGMTVSFGEARYEGADGAYITIKITDMGGTGFASMMAAGWTMQEIDRESDTGYERTTTIGGHKAMEKFDTQYNNGSTELMVAGRFHVEVEGSEIKPENLQQAVGKLDLNKLAALAGKK